MSRRTFLVTGLLLGAVLGTGEAAAQLPPPLPHVQNMESLEGKTMYLKQVSCRADGKPDTAGRLYLAPTGQGTYRAARIEYNDQGKYILDHVTDSAKGNSYFDRYVTRQQPLNLTTFNFILGLWRLFGLHFSLENVTYHCQVT